MHRQYSSQSAPSALQYPPEYLGKLLVRQSLVSTMHQYVEQEMLWQKLLNEKITTMLMIWLMLGRILTLCIFTT